MGEREREKKGKKSKIQFKNKYKSYVLIEDSMLYIASLADSMSG